MDLQHRDTHGADAVGEEQNGESEHQRIDGAEDVGAGHHVELQQQPEQREAENDARNRVRQECQEVEQVAGHEPGAHHDVGDKERQDRHCRRRHQGRCDRVDDDLLRARLVQHLVIVLQREALDGRHGRLAQIVDQRDPAAKGLDEARPTHNVTRVPAPHRPQRSWIERASLFDGVEVAEPARKGAPMTPERYLGAETQHR